MVCQAKVRWTEQPISGLYVRVLYVGRALVILLIDPESCGASRLVVHKPIGASLLLVCVNHDSQVEVQLISLFLRLLKFHSTGHPFLERVYDSWLRWRVWDSMGRH